MKEQASLSIASDLVSIQETVVVSINRIWSRTRDLDRAVGALSTVTRLPPRLYALGRIKLTHTHYTSQAAL